jgi:hypothetical protein
MTSEEVDQNTKENAKLMTYETSSSHGDVCRDPLDENSFFCPSGCVRHRSVPYCKATGPSGLHPCRVGKKEQPAGTWKKNAGQETAAVLRRPFNHAGSKRAGPMLPRTRTAEDAALSEAASSTAAVAAHPSADIDVFIRCSKAEAYRMLPYALESVRRFGVEAGLVRRAVVCFPALDAGAFAKVALAFPGGWLVLASSDAAARGLPGRQAEAFFDHLRADTLGATAPFVMHMDPSMLLCDTIRRADLISTHNGHDHRPFLAVAPFASLPPGVEAGVRGSMELVAPPEAVKHATLLGRSVFPKAAYGLLRRRLIAVHAAAKGVLQGAPSGGGGDNPEALLEAAVKAACRPLDNPLQDLHPLAAFGSALLYVNPDGRLRPQASSSGAASLGTSHLPLALVHAVPKGALLPAYYDFARDTGGKGQRGGHAFDPARDALHGCFARCVLESPSTADARCGPASALARHRPPLVKCEASLAGASGARADERRVLGFKLLHEERAERLLAAALDREARDDQDEKDAAARAARWG